MTDSTSVPQETTPSPPPQAGEGEQHGCGWGVGTWSDGMWGTERPSTEPKEPPQNPTTG
jgi:hypothetical protein